MGTTDRLMGLIERTEADPRGAADGSPGRYVHHGRLMRRVLNPIAVRLGRTTVLCVRGRKSGRLLSVPMDPPFELRGTRYLVSPLGDTHWARNLRAAGVADLRLGRRVEHIRAVELQGAERDAVVEAYANTITCGCLMYLRKLPDPADHPVFRIEPEAGAA